MEQMQPLLNVSLWIVALQGRCGDRQGGDAENEAN